MLITTLSVIGFILLAAEAVLLFQFIRCLSQHRNEPLEDHASYLIRRLNAALVIGFLIAAIQILLLFLR